MCLSCVILIFPRVSELKFEVVNGKMKALETNVNTKIDALEAQLL